MDGAIFRERCDSRTKGIESLSDKVMRDHYDVQFFYAVQELVEENFDHIHLLNDIWKDSLQRAVDGRIDDFEEFGRFLMGIFDRSIAAFEKTLADCRTCHEKGHPIDGEVRLRREIVEIRKIRNRIRHRWPVTDERAIECAMEDFRAGRSRSVRDIVNELRRTDSSQCGAGNQLLGS
jgi:hypothetical protein